LGRKIIIMIKFKRIDFKSLLKIDIKIFRNLIMKSSILSKMVAMFLALIVLPLSVIGYASTKTASKNLIQSVKDSVRGASYQASNNLDTFLDKALNISMQIISNDNIAALCKALNSDDSSERLTAQRGATKALASIDTAPSEMNSKVIFNSGYVLGKLAPPDKMETVFETDWYKQVLEANGAACWIDDYSEGMKVTTDYAFSIIRLYRTKAVGAPDGFLIVDINYEPITKILKNINLGKGESSYLLTPGGKIITENGVYEKEDYSNREFINEVRTRVSGKPSDLFNIHENGVNYLVSYYKSEKTGMTVITTVPYSAITAGARQILLTTIIIGILFAIIAVAIGFLFSLKMTNSLKTIMSAMSKAENGDLTVSVSMNRVDEIGSLSGSFNEMLKHIRQLVIQSTKAAEEVVAASKKMATISSQSANISSEIAQAIVEVASGSATQAAEVESSVKNVSALADRISLAVERTKAMESDSDYMRELSDIGINTIETLNRKATETDEITSKAVTEIAQLNEYVKNINVITRVLRSIADQTNLLALNAAIEAARAGEAGKGFAVVADEIRKLAEQSNNHTRNIQKHIEDIFRQTQTSTSLVQEAETSIREQSRMVGQTAEAFARINSTTLALNEKINNVVNMINEMDSFKENVINSMQSISSVSQQVSASTEEVSASIEEQLASVEQLDEMANKLNGLATALIEQMQKFTI